jgi:nitrogen regulatory protein P-II 1
VKRIEAIIGPLELGGVKIGLLRTGARGMTVSDIRELSLVRHLRENQEPVGNNELLPRVRVQVVAPDDMVDPIVQAIVQAARANKASDGRIIVSPVAEVIRVRTGERGTEAI